MTLSIFRSRKLQRPYLSTSYTLQREETSVKDGDTRTIFGKYTLSKPYVRLIRSERFLPHYLEGLTSHNPFVVVSSFPTDVDVLLNPFQFPYRENCERFFSHNHFRNDDNDHNRYELIPTRVLHSLSKWLICSPDRGTK